MPTYDYVCDDCGHAFELFQSITESAKKKCPKCRKSKLRRLFGTGAAIVFKGSGFYQTDYRSDSYKKRAAADKPASDSKSSDSKSSDSKGSSSGSSDKKSKSDRAKIADLATECQSGSVQTFEFRHSTFPLGGPAMSLIRCPTCGKTFDSDESKAMPFCSDRCRRVDLRRWLNEVRTPSISRSRAPDEIVRTTSRPTTSAPALAFRRVFTSLAGSGWSIFWPTVNIESAVA